MKASTPERGELPFDDASAFLLDGRVDNRKLANAFCAGQPAALRVVQEMATPLGRCLGMLHLAAGFERACIIGGFGLAVGTRYVELLSRAAAESAWNTGLDWSSAIELGPPDDDAALIGLGRALAWGQGMD